MLRARRSPPTFLCSRSRFWPVGSRVRTARPKLPLRLHRHCRPFGGLSGLQPNYSTHVQPDWSLATRTIGKVCHDLDSQAEKLPVFAGLGEEGRVDPPGRRRSPRVPPMPDTFVAAVGNALFPRLLPAERLSVIGRFVAKRPAEVFGICGQVVAGACWQAALTHRQGRPTC